METIFNAIMKLFLLTIRYIILIIKIIRLELCSVSQPILKFFKSVSINLFDGRTVTFLCFGVETQFFSVLRISGVVLVSVLE